MKKRIAVLLSALLLVSLCACAVREMPLKRETVPETAGAPETEEKTPETETEAPETEKEAPETEKEAPETETDAPETEEKAPVSAEELAAQLAGVWSRTEEGVTMYVEFREDGTTVIWGGSGGKLAYYPDTAEYSVRDGRLIFVVNGEEEDASSEIFPDGDTLTVRSSDGEEMTFIRETGDVPRPEEAGPETGSGEFNAGTQNGNTYFNDYFNFKFTLDDSWTFSDPEELSRLVSKYLDYSDSAALKEMIENGSVIYLAYAMNGANVINVNVTKYEEGYQNIDDYIEYILPNLQSELESYGYFDSISLGVADVTFCGEPRRAITVSGSVYGMTMEMTEIQIVRDNYIVTVTVCTYDDTENDRQAILDCFEKLY